MLKKLTVISQIEVLESGVVQVRTSTRIIENDKQISETYHRHCIAPGENYVAEDVKVQAICAAVHTPAVIAAYQAQMVAQAR